MSESISMNEAMATGAVRAVELAAESGISLDYSLESIEIVEQQLAQLHNQLQHVTPSDQEIQLMSLIFGTYIAEVLRRNFGGNWSNKSSLYPNYEVPTFTIQSIEINPQIKVEKRLINGPGDNIWHYFLLLLRQIGVASDLVDKVFEPDR